MFKVNNKDTRTTPECLWTYFTPCSHVYTVNFEQVIANWVPGKLLTCKSKTNNRALKKSRNIHRKTYVLESFFNTVAGFKICNLIKKRLQHRCFPVNICEIFKNSFCMEHLRWLLSNLWLRNKRPYITEKWRSLIKA